MNSRPRIPQSAARTMVVRRARRSCSSARGPAPEAIRDGVVDGGERSEAEPADLESRGVSVDVGRGNERDVLRFFREEWPLADEETFGRRHGLAGGALGIDRSSPQAGVGGAPRSLRGRGRVADEFVVGKGHRGRGLGSALLRRFETEALRHGCDRVVLRAVKDAESERFYRDRGYSRKRASSSHTSSDGTM